MRRSLLSLGFAALIALVACGPYVRSDFDPAVDFTRFKTYAQVPPPERGDKERVPVGPFLDGRIRAALDRELPLRGLVKAEGADSDLLVGYYLVLRDRVDWGFVSTYWGWGWVGVSPVPYSYTEGSLIVDLVDAKSRRLVWRGWATDALDPLGDPIRAQKRVDVAIAKILEKCPTAPKAP